MAKKAPRNYEADWKEIQAESRKLAKRANQRLVRLERAAEKPGMKNILKYAYKAAVKDIKSTGKDTGKPRFKENVKLYDDLTDGSEALTGDDLYKANIKIQRQRIKMMKDFLGAASSTIGQGRSGTKEEIEKPIGIKKIWDKTTKTINKKYLKKYDLRLSTDDMKSFFDSKKQAKLEKIVGSGRMFIVASYIKKNNLKTNKKDLEKFMKDHIDLKKNELTEDDIKSRKGESYKDYLDRLNQYVKYTDDQVLNDMINKALKGGINVDNIFI